MPNPMKYPTAQVYEVYSESSSKNTNWIPAILGSPLVEEARQSELFSPEIATPIVASVLGCPLPPLSRSMKHVVVVVAVLTLSHRPKSIPWSQDRLL